MKNEATGKLLLFRKNKESGEDNSVINLIDKKIKKWWTRNYSIPKALFIYNARDYRESGKSHLYRNK